MNSSATRARLDRLTKDLLFNWDETRAAWRDAKAQEFEQKYLEELRLRVEKAAAGISKLDELLTKVRTDCE